MDKQIATAKEEASSRKAILERVQKWMLAREEERWLEEYNRVTSQSYMPLEPQLCRNHLILI